MNFGLIGAAGYVAPRHMKAIKDTGNNLKVALDPHDSVGIMDSYFPECKFFTETERFDRHILKYEKLDYISICSPNYLHESHIKLALRLDANAICEKPLVTNISNLSQLKKVENKAQKKIFSILQLRLHPNIKTLKKIIDKSRYYEIDLKYITPRGPWYFHSWKGTDQKSGGIEANIGIHFFDILLWMFGKYEKIKIDYKDKYTSKGELFLKNAHIKWFLSLNRNSLPDKSLNFYRSMAVDNKQISFDDGFSDLHTESYKEIFKGNGFTIDDCLPAIYLIDEIKKIK